MTMPAKFALPETHEAYLQWELATGLGWDSPEWGEVWRVLDDCGLLLADRLPERGLFDLPGTRLGDTLRVVHLRAVIVVGAWLYRTEVVPDPATGTEIAAALLERHYHDERGWPFAKLSLRLALDIPRRDFAVHGCPGDALTDLLAAQDPATPADDTLGWVAFAAAAADDRFAEAVFERLAVHEDWRRALVPLTSGRWLSFRCNN